MMEDMPDHPLDLNALVTLPPSQWTISPYEGGVMIGAWAYPRGEGGIIKRPFKFTVYEGQERA